MCGIAGVVGLGRVPDQGQAGILGRMLDLMRHRGPDDRGQADLEGALLGHLRLSILDLSPRGHQPMFTPDGRLAIIYNGEVYNYIELRQELKALGESFQSDSDTEVVLKAYARWGLDCLARFNGMWALAIWERDAKRLVLARDRVGIKPLYLAAEGGLLAFASEVKALAAWRLMNNLPLNVNPDAVQTYLRTGLVDGLAQTFFIGIERLKPGHLLVIERGRVQQPRPYWDLPGIALNLRDDLAGLSEKAQAERLSGVLADAVSKHCRSDVPVGVCLSGGLDSSAVAGLAAAEIPGLKTFTAWFAEGGEFNELTHAAKVVERFHLASFKSEVPGLELMEKLPQLLWHLDEPTLAMGVYPQWHVMESAASQVTVVMDGQGGDEIFAGYDFYASRLLLSLLRQGRTKDYQRTLAGFHANYGLARADQLGQEVKSLFLSGEQNRGHGPFPGLLDNFLYQELLISRLPALLRYEDRLSMAFSMESRVPLLDHRLIEMSFALPETRKVGPGWSKHVFRQACEGLLPPDITWRKDKKGFPTPFLAWAEGPLKEPIRSLLSEPNARIKDWLDAKALWGFFGVWDQGNRDHWRLWRMLSLELWLRTYEERLRAELAAPAPAQAAPRRIPRLAGGDSKQEPAPTQPAPSPPACQVVVTLDYETFDTNDLVLDAGYRIDWQRDLIAPTARLARCLEDVGAKLTVLWDTVEYFWLKDQGKNDVASAIEEQLTDLVAKGHDVQLHLHPAWAHVREQDGRMLWPRPGLTAPAMDPAELAALVGRSVLVMEELFRPIRPAYAVRGFRGRSYEVEPFAVIAQTLMEAGIRADSSYHGTGPLTVAAPRLTQAVPAQQADFLEYPILALGQARWDMSSHPSLATLPLTALSGEPPAGQTLVMIGHCKQTIHFDQLARCLNGLKDRWGDRVVFVTWQESIEGRLAQLPARPAPKPGFSADYFEARWQEADPFASGAVDDPYYRRLLDLLPERADSFLDLGSAEGHFTACAAARLGASRALGVDISASAVARAQAAHPEVQFKAANLLHLRAGERFDCVLTSQNLYYFTPPERAALLANLEAMLAPDGLLLAAWWTGAKRGMNEEAIEDELGRFFRLEHSETYAAPQGAAIKGEHRLVACRRRLSLEEEDLLGALYWRGRRVVCVSGRGRDYRARFGWQCAEWSEKPGPAEVVICDKPTPELLAGLAMNGTLVVVGARPDLSGALWVHEGRQLSIAARVGDLAWPEVVKPPAARPAIHSRPLHVCFVKLAPQLRIFKQALGLKKHGNYRLTLLSMQHDPRLVNGLFDEVHHFDNVDRLVELVRGLKPDIFHAHAEPNTVPSLVLDNAAVPVIYDTYDFAGLQHGVAALSPQERSAERHCLEQAAGIVNKFPAAALDYYRGLGYQIIAPVLHYQDYCAAELSAPLPNVNGRPPRWAIAHVGTAAPASLPAERFHDMQFHDLARLLNAQGIEFHLYANPYQYQAEQCQCYAALADQLPHFFLHHPVHPFSLAGELSGYHWGSFFAAHRDEQRQMEGPLTIGNKFASYLEAGLPILVNRQKSFVAGLVEGMGVGLVIEDWSRMEGLKEILDAAHADRRPAIKQARADWSIERHWSRLAGFYAQVLG